MRKLQLPLFVLFVGLFGSATLQAQDNQRLIKDYMTSTKGATFKKADLQNFEIDNTDPSTSLKGDVVKIQQTYNGLPIYSSVGTVLIKDKKVIYSTENFQKNYNTATSKTPTLAIESAFGKMASSMSVKDANQYQIIGFFAPDLTTDFAKSRLTYFPLNDDLKLAYEFSFPEKGTSNYWDIIVDANSGDILSKQNLTVSCDFNKDAFSHDYVAGIFPQNQNYYPQNAPMVSLAADNASYNVYPYPVEAPTFGSRAVLNNPWILASSPEGWHSDGTNHYTNTRGNNVYAYEDMANANAPGLSPDGGAARNFNFPIDLSLTAASNLDAGITNLFYINNKVHDIFYKFGFNEAARNFQQNNFSLGGVGNDYVRAEAQDGGGTDNANFSTPQDGGGGRMQMYVWTPSPQILKYNAPAAAIPRIPATQSANFGPTLDTVSVTADVKLSPVLDGCTALPANSLSNKIGLIERGTCNFTVKVKNAQNAGAKAVIVYNATTSVGFGIMGGDDLTITIPSILVENTEGEYIKSVLAASTVVNATMTDDPSTYVYRDGSLDTGVVSHEYGHGISNRNTGNGYTCLNSSVSKEQMGEGWSDFFGLMQTNQPGDNASVPRGIGTYVISEATTGGGIRPAKYSPDFAVNDYTYTDTNGMEYTNSASQIVPDVHSIGFVWATMLWDLNWQYVAKYGYSSDVTSNTTSGSARVLQLVLNGIKLQACNPNFVQGRDAILAAELAATGGVDKCMIWRAFAKRGLGVNATAGSATNINDQVEDLNPPAECLLATSEVSANAGISIYPNPAKNEFSIKLPSNILGKLKVEIYDASGKLAISQDRLSTEDVKSISTQSLTNGVYVVKVTGLGIEKTTKLIIKK